MGNPYFSMTDHTALVSQSAFASQLTVHAQGSSSQSTSFHGSSIDDTQPSQTAHAKLMELHRTLHRRMRERSWDLHPHWDRSRWVYGASAACRSDIQGLTLPYLRSYDQAVLVERLMGREGNHAATSTDIHRHPVIELRLTPEHFVVELVLTPTSWWDQRNLIGKLSIERHRQTLRTLLQQMNGEYRFGFWEGIHLSDMHLTSRQLLRTGVLDEWMSTFSDGQDWLRVGVWYEPENAALCVENILDETLHRIGALNEVYKFLLWSGNNNFHSFYRSGGSVASSTRARHN